MVLRDKLNQDKFVNYVGGQTFFLNKFSTYSGGW